MTDATIHRDDPHHAGFDVTVAIAAPALQDVIATLYCYERIPTRFTGSYADESGRRIDYDLRLGEPRLVLEENPANHVALRLRLAGHVLVTAEGDPNKLDNDIRLDFGFGAPLRFVNTSEANGVRVNLALSEAVIDSDRDLRAFVPGTTTPDSSNEVILGAMLQSVLDQIQSREFDDLEFAVPLGDLGDIDITPDLAITLKVGNDVVFLAADGIALGNPAPGDPDLLHDFTFGRSVAAVVHPRIVEEQIALLAQDTKSGLKDVTINRLNFALKQQYIQFHGEASKDGVDADFSFRLSVGVDSKRQQIRAGVSHVNIVLPWWVTFVNVFLTFLILPAGLITTNIIARSLRDGEYRATRGIGAGLLAETQPALFELDIAPEVKMRAIVKSVRLGHNGAEFFLRWTTPRRNIGIRYDWWQLYVDEGRDDLDVEVFFPAGLLNRNDPDVEFRWKYLREDRSAPRGRSIRSGVEKLCERLDDERALQWTFRVTPGAIGYSFHGEVVRITDEGEEKLAEVHPGFMIEDRLDKRHRYVYWEHDVWRKNKMMGLSDRTVALESWKFRRRSRVHRTAWPGRCRFADQYSSDETLELFYIDELPIDPRYLGSPRHRDKVEKVLCNYCFPAPGSDQRG